MKRFYILALAATLLLACGTTVGAAVLKMPPKRPQNADSLKSEQTPTTSPLRCAVTAGYLNFRACGATSCDVIEVLEEGARLTILELGDWLQVQTDDGAIGWAYSKYCKLEK